MSDKRCLNNNLYMYMFTLLNSSGAAIKELQNSSADICTNGNCSISFAKILTANSGNYSVKIVSNNSFGETYLGKYKVNHLFLSKPQFQCTLSTHKFSIFHWKTMCV